MEDKDIIDFMNKEMKKALYPNEEEMKETINKIADNTEIARLSRENAYLKEVIKRQNEILKIFRKNAYVYDDEFDIEINDQNENFDTIIEWMKFYGE